MNGTGKVKIFSFPYFIVVFLAFSIAYFLLAVFMQIKINLIKTEETAIRERQLLKVESNILSSRIERLVSDVLYLADRAEAQGLSAENIEKMKEDWIDFSDRKKIYDRIRLLDTDGNKILRINYDPSGSYARTIPDAVISLDTPWFHNAVSLKKSHVYISRLDLDKRDTGELLKPASPMIHVSAPVYTGKNVSGVLVVNYSAKYLIKEFRDIASSSFGHLLLLNKDGYYLINTTDRATEFAFMYPKKQDKSFKMQFPAEWEAMQKAQSGQFQTGNGYFVYANIVPYNGLLENGLRLADGGFALEEGNWMIVSYVTVADQKKNGIMNSISFMAESVISQNVAMFAVILVLSLIISILFAINKATKDRIKFYSEYDMMTGALNRRAGMETLERTYQEASKDKKHISVCFIDINGLKQINDHLGHEKGDELIVSVVEGVKRTIRTIDYMIRLGGDEFLIVYPSVNLEQAESAWKRAEAEFDRINTEEDRPYLISVSHGVAEVAPEVRRVIDELLNDADAKMYAEKRVKKVGLNVIKER